jgi:hypothetical protein
VLLAAAKQRLHILVMVPNPAQLLEPHGLPRPQHTRQRLHMGEDRAGELCPRQGVEGTDRLQGLGHLPEPLVEGAHGVLIGGLQVLLGDRRGAGCRTTRPPRRARALTSPRAGLLPSSTLASRALTPRRPSRPASGADGSGS